MILGYSKSGMILGLKSKRSKLGLGLATIRRGFELLSAFWFMSVFELSKEPGVIVEAEGTGVRRAPMVLFKLFGRRLNKELDVQPPTPPVNPNPLPYNSNSD